MRLSSRIHGGWAPLARLPALATAAAVLLVHASAEGREVDYRAPSECPPAADVTARIESRAPRGAPARLAIAKTKSGFHGDLVAGEGDSRLARSVDARSCGAVVEALALVLALASDAEDARPIETAEPAEPVPGAPPAPAGAHSDRDDGNAASTPTAPAAQADKPATEATDSGPRRLFGFGSNVSYSGFSENHTLFGISVYGDLALPARILGLSFLQPSFRASIGGTLPQSSSAGVVRQTPIGPGQSTFCADCGPEITMLKTAFDACPVGVNLDGGVSFTACARGEIGMLIADLSGSTAAAERRAWMAAGPMIRSRVVWGSGDYRPVFELTAGAVAPLRRDRFHYDDYPTVAAAPWVWSAGFGAGMVFR